MGEEIEARYAPDLNGRFVRVTRGDGRLLYVSQPPKDQTFRSRANAAAHVVLVAPEPRARRRCPEAGKCS